MMVLSRQFSLNIQEKNVFCELIFGNLGSGGSRIFLLGRAPTPKVGLFCKLYFPWRLLGSANGR